MRRCLLVVPLVLLILGSALSAQGTPTIQGTCTVRGDSVLLTWGDSAGIFVPPDTTRARIDVYRDGALLATLAPFETSFLDQNVPAGEHRYLVTLIFIGIEMPDRILLECAVVVMPFPGPHDLVCEVVCTTTDPAGGIVATACHVSLNWKNGANTYIAILIVRDEHCAVLLPGSSTSWVDLNVPPGLHRYLVFGVIRGILPAPADDLIDAFNREPTDENARRALEVICPDRIRLTKPAECVVEVPDVGPGPGPYNLVCLYIEVDSWGKVPELANADATLLPALPFSGVLLIWTNGAPYHAVKIKRDGAPIAMLPGDAWYYLDPRVPAGAHTYAVSGLIHDFETHPAVCRVWVPGPHVPPPVADLTCNVICPVRADDPRCADTRCWPCPVPSMVALEWRNTAPYTAILIARDGDFIAELPGEATHFIDREPPPGVHVYAVVAVRDGMKSPEALCRVEVPPLPPIAPPRDLVCRVACEVAPDAPDQLRCAVRLTWVNGEPAYDKIIIVRDGEHLATIDGTREAYTDLNVPLGDHVYAVSGVMGDKISAAAICKVTVPLPPLEPPSDLVCLPNAGPEPLDPATDPGGIIPGPMNAVYLRWRNGSVYDAVLVRRDGELIEKLPGESTHYVDYGVAPGVHTYAVSGIRENEETPAAECTVELGGIVPPPQNLVCEVVDVLDPTFEDGFMGAAVSLTWENPPPGGAIGYLHILIFRNGTLIARLEGTATSYLDRGLLPGSYAYGVVGVTFMGQSFPALCRVEVGGQPLPPLDLACAVLPIACITGEDCPPAVVELSWRNPIRYAAILIVRNGERLVNLPGDAERYTDYRVTLGETYAYEVRGVLANGEVTDPAECTVTIGPEPPIPPHSLACEVANGDVFLKWIDGQAYANIIVVRDGAEIAVLPGDATSYVDAAVPAGRHCYLVFGVTEAGKTAAARCCVFVPGNEIENVLYFSSSAAPRASGLVESGLVGMAVCIADNKDPLEAWSFGVCNDPTLLTPTDATVEGTFAGDLDLGFLAIGLEEGGVTMGAIIQPILLETVPADGARAIEPGRGRTLLAIAYAARADGRPDNVSTTGEYWVNYCERLGDPPVPVIFVVDGFEVTPRTIPGTVILTQPSELSFLRGDVNADGDVNIGDVIAALVYLFRDQTEPVCIAAADANASREVNIADPVYLLNFLFAQGPTPPGNFPGCDPYDPATAEDLTCDSYPQEYCATP